MKFDRKYLKPTFPACVESGVPSAPPRPVFSFLNACVVLTFALLCGLTPRSGLADPLPAPPPDSLAAPAASTPAVSPAPAAAKPDRDELVYNDGDRIRGHFVQQDGATIVFNSDRFGTLRVTETEAKVVLAVPPSPGMPSTAPAVSTGPAERAVMAAADADRLWMLSYLSPVELKRRLQRMFGSWHGKFQFSTELVTDIADRSTVTVEGHLERKWTSDDVQLNTRYDYSETDDIATTDIMKTDGAWRHDFPDKLFSIYRPSLEWNHAYLTPAGVPSDYVLLQQEIGGGVNIVSTPDRQLRAGISENLLNLWQTADPAAKPFRAVESVFAETQWGLPWRITVKDRGVLYYSVASNEIQGWENHFEIDKKLTETLSVAVQHELRHSEEDLSVQDYTLLKLLIGLDF